MSTANAIDLRLAYWQNFKYYEGHLFFKVQKVGYEKRWMVLLGNEIHVYSTKIPQREQGSSRPIQHYPLHPSISISVDNDFKMHIKCELWTIRAQATSNEERENWRIRILTIARGETPDQGRLLPGQQELLADILQKESVRKQNHGKPVGQVGHRRGSLPGISFSSQATPGRRRGSSFTDGPHQYTDNTYYKFLPEDIAFSQVLPPVWFVSGINRGKAEEILNQSTFNGDILLRQSEAHPGKFSLSVRQDTDNKSLVRHYMIEKNPYGFRLLIEDKAPVLASMYEVMWFFIQESGGHLLPLQGNPNTTSSIFDVGGISPHYKTPANGETSSRPLSRGMSKSFSMDDHAMMSHKTGHMTSQQPEDEYLVPDAISPRGRVSSSTSRSPLMSVSESFDETVDTYAPADDDMPSREAPRPPSSAGQHQHFHPAASSVSPSHHRSELPLPSPPGESGSLTTGYVKMRSFHSAPTLQQRPKHDDVGYINMKKQSSLDEGCIPEDIHDDDGDGKHPTPPPLPRKSRSHHGYCTHLKSVPEEVSESGFTSPLVQHLKSPLRPTNSCPPSNMGELQKAFRKFGLREESST